MSRLIHAAPFVRRQSHGPAMISSSYYSSHCHRSDRYCWTAAAIWIFMINNSENSYFGCALKSASRWQQVIAQPAKTHMYCRNYFKSHLQWTLAMVLNWSPDLGSFLKHPEDAQEEQMMRVGMKKKKLEKNPSPQVATYFPRLLPWGLLNLLQKQN